MPTLCNEYLHSNHNGRGRRVPPKPQWNKVNTKGGNEGGGPLANLAQS